ncbi:MAG: VWA domain-containing protein [Bacteroidetes bacterium]|nr:VWA domain-containing protein [Bacteroidota bacterium]
MWDNLTFRDPEFFWLLLIIPIMAVWYWRRNRQQFVELKLSSLKGVEKVRSIRVYLREIMPLFRAAAILLIIVALARPQSTSSDEKVETEGIDIVLVTDISSSMLAEDLKPNRIEASKNVAIEFIDRRPNDRIGLVVFAGESFSQCPITTDHMVLKNLLREIKSGWIEDGTAIGMGLATAVNRLKESEAESKVIILLTDGINNSGFIDPLTAVEIARQFSIRVYTIGVGTEGFAPYPVKTPFGVQIQQMEVKIDENLLQQIAEMTGGKYFRAANNKKLKEIYKSIDEMEKSKIEITAIQRHSEQFLGFAFWGTILLLSELLIRYSLFRSVT